VRPQDQRKIFCKIGFSLRFDGKRKSFRLLKFDLLMQGGDTLDNLIFKICKDLKNFQIIFKKLFIKNFNIF
jgi:hypothetical protein